MRLLQITSQHRRDFTGDYKCEFCEHVEEKVSGYDDSYFHNNVTPGIECKKCQKSTLSEQGDVQKVSTKYPEGYQI
jgi:hypothetical protein